MKSKKDMRSLIEQNMLTFISSGKEITKTPSKKSKTKNEVKYVEIDVDSLPKALQDKYFGE